MKSAALVSLQNFFVGKSTSDADRFETLFNKNVHLVRAVIFQMAGHRHLDDLTQEVFIKIWQNQEQFRHEANLKSWIYRIAVNTALDHLRSTKRKAEDFDHDLEALESKSTATDEAVIQKQILHKALLSLKEEHRTVVVLALMQGCSLAEVSEITGVAEGTVKSRLHYGKEHLKQFISELLNKDSV